MRTKISILAIVLVLTSGVAQAGTITLSGYFDDPLNAALVGSDLGPALFGDDLEIANNVALYDLVIPYGGNVTFSSFGYEAGGADPYFTLFQGLGPSATFFGSNYDQAFSTGGDFLLTFVLPAGNYTVAMGVFANESFAENSGSGTLNDGFIGLGVPGYLGSYYYELEVTSPDEPQIPVPDPGGTLPLLSLALLGCFARRKKA